MCITLELPIDSKSLLKIFFTIVTYCALMFSTLTIQLYHHRCISRNLYSSGVRRIGIDFLSIGFKEK